MIEPTITGADQNAMADAERMVQQRREHREEAAVLLYEALAMITATLYTRAGPAGLNIGEVGLKIHIAIKFLELGGVAVARLPTAQEMDR